MRIKKMMAAGLLGAALAGGFALGTAIANGSMVSAGHHDNTPPPGGGQVHAGHMWDDAPPEGGAAFTTANFTNF